MPIIFYPCQSCTGKAKSPLMLISMSEFSIDCCITDIREIIPAETEWQDLGTTSAYVNEGINWDPW